MIRALVVDDEAPARAKVRDLLEKEDDLEVVTEAASGREAVELLRGGQGERRPDVVFLDIQMPGLDGFGVVEEVGVDAMPLTVFVTAHDDRALDAFEVHALDYLLKPFAPSRFRKVLDRVRRRLGEPDSKVAEGDPAGDLAERLERMLESVQSRTPRYLERLQVSRDEGREVLLPVAAIDRIRADRNDLRIFTAEGEYRRRGTLSDLEKRVDPDRFLRINRSEIVRLDAVQELQRWFHGDYRVVMKDGTNLTWSRRYRAQAKGRF